MILLLSDQHMDVSKDCFVPLHFPDSVDTCLVPMISCNELSGPAGYALAKPAREYLWNLRLLHRVSQLSEAKAPAPAWWTPDH